MVAVVITLTATDPMNFPVELLKNGDTALVLFAAGFRGIQDAYWIKEAGMNATCVDDDPVKLGEMAPLYPEDWEFVLADAYNFALKGTERRQWDIVTADPFTYDMDKCARFIREWCRLARKAVVIGTKVDTYVEAPDGWKVTSTVKRTDYDGGVYWKTLEPA